MRYRFLLSLALVAALTVACGGPKATTQPPVQESTKAPPPTAQPTAKPAVEATKPPEEYSFGDASDLSRLSSYRVHYVLSWESTKEGKREGGSWDLIEEFVRDPPAQHIVWSGTGAGGAEQEGKFELITIGKDSYMNTGTQWLAMTTSQENPLEANAFLSDPMGFVSGNRGKLVQRGVSVNGVSTDHYAFDETAMAPGVSLGGVAKARGDVWVSPELNVVVKYTARFEGKALVFGGGDEGWMDTALDLTDANKPIEIKAPEGVGPALPADVPVMDGATDLVAFSGMVSYKVSKSVDEAKAFYEAQMPAQGWTKGESAVEDILSFTKGERNAMVTIVAEDGMTSVSVYSQQ